MIKDINNAPEVETKKQVADDTKEGSLKSDQPVQTAGPTATENPDVFLDPGLKPDERALSNATNPYIKSSILRTDLEGYSKPLPPSDEPPKVQSLTTQKPLGEVLLKTDGITMQFGGLTAVNEFNLILEKGQIVALIGPNGAGKTTAFNMITGVYKPTKGRVWFKDRDITDLKPDAITRLGIARTFQNIRLFRDLTVYENVLIGNHLRIKSSFLSATANLPGYRKEETYFREKTERLLKRVGLWGQRAEKAGSLPYGKQRRLEIARALATEPEVLLLDEPAAGMNPKETEDLTEFIRQIRDEFNLTIFMIEHHMQVVMGISDKIYVFDYGTTIAQGTAKEIQNNQRVIVAYLGVDEEDA